MAEESALWVVHVTGGAQDMPVRPREEVVNVPYGFAAYPSGAAAAIPSLRVSAGFVFPAGTGGVELSSSHATWLWTSCSNCTGNPPGIGSGGKLAVGVPFSRFFPCGDYDFTKVEVWAKFEVSAPTNRLSAVYMSICDSNGNISDSASLTSIPTGWQVICHELDAEEMEGWDSENLRAVITLEGTTNGSNAGGTSVSLEWFAIRLTRTLA